MDCVTAVEAHLLGVLEVLEKSLLVPGNTLVDVGSTVGETFTLTSLTAKDTIKHFKVSRSF